MVTVIGNSTALRRLTKAEIDELNMCKEVVWAILSKLEKHGLADSIHAPPGADIEDKLHRERLKVKKEAAISKRAVYDNSKDEAGAPGVPRFKEVRRIAPTGPEDMNDVKNIVEPNTGRKVDATGIHPLPRVIDPKLSAPLHRQDSSDNKDTAEVKSAEKAEFVQTSVLSGAAACFVPRRDYALEPKDADSNDEIISTKSAGEAGSGAGKGSLTSRPKSSRSQGVTDPNDFMEQVRKLRKTKELAARAAVAGPVRRVVFGNLPKWATISGILQLVYGGAIERAWIEDGEIIVQFVQKADCEKYYQDHSDGINYSTGDGNQAIMSVTLPEDGLRDNAELSARVSEGASRVVRLAGLPSGHKDSDNSSILGIVSQPGWDDKQFERILITQAESGVDVIITFYDLHDGWQFLQDIKDNDYDCIARYDVDPCARASTYHFIEEPNPTFEFVMEVA